MMHSQPPWGEPHNRSDLPFFSNPIASTHAPDLVLADISIDHLEREIFDHEARQNLFTMAVEADCYLLRELGSSSPEHVDVSELRERCGALQESVLAMSQQLVHLRHSVLWDGIEQTHGELGRLRDWFGFEYHELLSGLHPVEAWLTTVWSVVVPEYDPPLVRESLELWLRYVNRQVAMSRNVGRAGAELLALTLQFEKDYVGFQASLRETLPAEMLENDQETEQVHRILSKMKDTIYNLRFSLSRYRESLILTQKKPLDDIPRMKRELAGQGRMLTLYSLPALTKDMVQEVSLLQAYLMAHLSYVAVSSAVPS
jgi:hypothetical protein